MISVGAGNDYGHPAASTIQRLNESGTAVYRTDEKGNIVVSTDGNTFSVQTEKSEPVTQTVPTSQVQQQSQYQEQSAEPTTGGYVGSIKSNKYHLPTCRYAQQISPYNQTWFSNKEEARVVGYVPCKACCGN